MVAARALCVQTNARTMLKPLHRADGTHRLEDPVSKTTVKGCGGVPREMSPKYCAFIKSLSGTLGKACSELAPPALLALLLLHCAMQPSDDALAAEVATDELAAASDKWWSGCRSRSSCRALRCLRRRTEYMPLGARAERTVVGDGGLGTVTKSVAAVTAARVSVAAVVAQGP